MSYAPNTFFLLKCSQVYKNQHRHCIVRAIKMSCNHWGHRVYRDRFTENDIELPTAQSNFVSGSETLWNAGKGD